MSARALEAAAPLSAAGHLIQLPPDFPFPEGTYFDVRKAVVVVRFIERLLRHVTGRWDGKPFELELWEIQDIICPLFGVIEASTGKRYFREALVGLARKNGKSEICAALALYLLIADGEPGAEVYSAAADKDQAKIVHKTARRMAVQSPLIRPWINPLRDVIEVKETGAIYRALSSDAPRKHGLNPHTGIIDELHAHKDPELYYAIRTAFGAREQPLLISITTAGFDEKTICFERFQNGMKGVVVPGTRGMMRIQGRMLLYWRQPMKQDESGEWVPWLDCSIDDPEAWNMANPSSWRGNAQAHIESLGENLPEAVYRRLYLNQWTRVAERWIPMDRWDACSGRPDIPEGVSVVVGVDAAPKRDTTAVVVCWAQPPEESEIPEVVEAEDDVLPPPQRSTIHAVARIFRADPTSGLLDFEEVEDLIRDLARMYFVIQVRYDPYHMTRSAITLMNEGIEMVEFPQNDSRMVPASQALFTVVKETRLLHGGDPELREHADAAAAIETRRGWRLDKLKATNPIDAIVALAMAVDALENEDLAGAPTIRAL